MAVIPCLNPELLTSEERWRRWEQRGRDNDVRFMRRVRRVFWSAVLVITAAMLVSLLY